MSTTVLAIGLGHALFPIIGYLLKGKVGLWFGAGLGALIGIGLGGSRYSIIDLIGVVIGIGIIAFIMKLDKDNA